ncbi:MAG: S8 family serine peptidase [Polyangiales bacterium]
MPSPSGARAWLVLSALLVALLPRDTVHSASQPSVRTPTPAARDHYRDGAHHVSFERIGAPEHGLTRLRLHSGAHAFHAQVGNAAVIQVRDPARATDVLRALDLRAVRVLSEALGVVQVEGRVGEDGAALAARLRNARTLVSAVPDLYTQRARHQMRIPPSDPRYRGQWYLDSLQIEGAWRIDSGKRDVTIAVIDDGCDMQHPDLKPQLVGGIDVLDGDEDPSFAPGERGNSHGTACAGVAAAAGDNGVGIAGTCPRCTLACVRLVGGSERPTPLSADVAAFDYAHRIGAAVVSNSWGYAEAQPVAGPLAAAIRRVAEDARGGRGAVVVFAAGNENRAIANDELAALPFVLAVGAVNRFDEAAPFANHGVALDLSAPTGSLTTDIQGPEGDSPDDYTNLFGGTSAACPVVAGIAGLALSAAPSATAHEVRDALTRTARPAPFAVVTDGPDPIYGHGIVQPAAALAALRTREGVVDGGSGLSSLGEPTATAARADDGGCTLTRAGSLRQLAPLLIAWLVVRALRRRTERAPKRARRQGASL